MAALPNLFIVGEPKTGTGALHVLLAQHPDVFMCPEKEPKFFSTDLREESDAYWGAPKYFPYRTREQYLGLYKDARNERVLGESTTQYLYSKTAAREIHAFNPDARIVMMFREPVQWLYSLHAQEYAFGREVPDFAEALALEPNRREGRDLPRLTQAPSLHFYTERRKFADNAQRYFDVFPRDQILVLLFDDWRGDNLGVFRTVCEFLDVDAAFVPPQKNVNENAQPRSASLNRFLLGNPLKRALQRMMPVNLYVALKPHVKKLVWKTAKRPPLDPELAARLRRECKPEVERLGALLGVDLVSRWGYEDV